MFFLNANIVGKTYQGTMWNSEVILNVKTLTIWQHKIKQNDIQTWGSVSQT